MGVSCRCLCLTANRKICVGHCEKIPRNISIAGYVIKIRNVGVQNTEQALFPSYQSIVCSDFTAKVKTAVFETAHIFT
jgi:hypothetical protein